MASINKVQHDAFSVSSNLGGINLIAHIGHLVRVEDGKGTRHEALLNDLAADLQRWQAEAAAANGLQEYFHATRGLVRGPNGSWWRFLTTLRQRYGDWDVDWFRRAGDANSAALDIALLAIKARPWEYAKHVATHYAYIWRHFFLSGQADFPTGADLPAAAYRHYQDNKALHRMYNGRVYGGRMGADYLQDPQAGAGYAARAKETTLIGRWWALVVGNRKPVLLALAALFPLSFALLLARRYRRDPTALFCAYLAFALLANVLMFAAVHTRGAERYILPLLPLLPLFALGMAVTLGRLLSARHAQRQKKPG